MENLLIERLFEEYADELNNIYEDLGLRSSTIKIVEGAVKEKLADVNNIDPLVFLAIVENVCYSPEYTTKKGTNKNLSKKAMGRRVEHIKGRFLDDSVEEKIENDFSDGNHDYGTGTNIKF